MPRVHISSSASAPWEQGGVAERWRTPFLPIAAPIGEASHGGTKNKEGGVEADEGILLTLFQNGQLMGGLLWFFHVRIKYWQKCTYATDRHVQPYVVVTRQPRKTPECTKTTQKTKGQDFA